jgi:probable rRNA maturation factor
MSLHYGVIMVTVNILESDEVEGFLKIDRKRLEKYAGDVLAESGIAVGEYNIVFIDDEYMTELNRLYKDRHGTTDVLSFNLGDIPANSSEGVSGEVYISLERAEEQAQEMSVSCDEEVVRLVTHGLLHLAGRVHDTDETFASMAQDTEKLVKSFFTAGSGK